MRTNPTHTSDCIACQACCTPFEIDELKKPAGVTCPHLAHRCTVYENRPTACRKFRCRWLLEEQRPEWRPDKLGLIQVRHIYGGRCPLFVVYILWVAPGFSEITKEGEGLITELFSRSPRTAVIVRRAEDGIVNDELRLPPGQDFSDEDLEILRDEFVNG